MNQKSNIANFNRTAEPNEVITRQRHNDAHQNLWNRTTQHNGGILDGGREFMQ